MAGLQRECHATFGGVMSIWARPELWSALRALQYRTEIPATEPSDVSRYPSAPATAEPARSRLDPFKAQTPAKPNSQKCGISFEAPATRQTVCLTHLHKHRLLWSRTAKSLSLRGSSSLYNLALTLERT
jgi:hypothetical protein